MLILRDGHEMDFACASGALGWAGEGYWWEKPLRWAGLIAPAEITVITKTLPYLPRKGNLRWWCPWRCVRPLGGGNFVNAVGLTCKKGFHGWIDDGWPAWATKKGHNLVASIAPDTTEQAIVMMNCLARYNAVKGVQLNASCPNVAQKTIDEKVFWLGRVLMAMLPCRKMSGLPVILKLGVTDPIERIIGVLDELVDGYELINTVPWDRYADPGVPSPLAKYGLVGGVSGPVVRFEAREALVKARALTALPIVSGGGIDSVEEIDVRCSLGANAYAIGSLFLSQPWKPRALIREARAMGYGRGGRG